MDKVALLGELVLMLTLLVFIVGMSFYFNWEKEGSDFLAGNVVFNSASNESEDIETIRIDDNKVATRVDENVTETNASIIENDESSIGHNNFDRCLENISRS